MTIQPLNSRVAESGRHQTTDHRPSAIACLASMDAAALAGDAAYVYAPVAHATSGTAQRTCRIIFSFYVMHGVLTLERERKRNLVLRVGRSAPGARGTRFKFQSPR